jgi:hypothetical protein
MTISEGGKTLVVIVHGHTGLFWAVFQQYENHLSRQCDPWPGILGIQIVRNLYYTTEISPMFEVICLQAVGVAVFKMFASALHNKCGPSSKAQQKALPIPSSHSWHPLVLFPVARQNNLFVQGRLLERLVADVELEVRMNFRLFLSPGSRSQDLAYLCGVHENWQWRLLVVFFWAVGHP